jgi:hypothetical protein
MVRKQMDGGTNNKRKRKNIRTVETQTTPHSHDKGEKEL